jgi:hypothetical protein
VRLFGAGVSLIHTVGGVRSCRLGEGDDFRIADLNDEYPAFSKPAHQFLKFHCPSLFAGEQVGEDRSLPPDELYKPAALMLEDADFQILPLQTVACQLDKLRLV